MKSIYCILSWRLIVGLFLLTDVYGQTDTLSFLHLTDTHLIFHYDHFPQGALRPLNPIAKSVEQFVHFFQTDPIVADSKMVMITGDMIDFYETGDRKKDMFSFQIQQFASIPEISQIPVFCVLGNHDVATYAINEKNWYQFVDEPDWFASQINVGKARAEWIRNVPCFADGIWYNHVYHIGQTVYRFIFLDNSTGPSKSPYLGNEQLDWLKDQLEQSPDEVKILFMHKPFSTELITDPAGNLFYALLTQHPSVKLIVAGDEHRNVIDKFDGTGFIQVETASFGYDGAGSWRLIRLTADKIIVSSAGTKQTELSIPIK